MTIKDGIINIDLYDASINDLDERLSFIKMFITDDVEIRYYINFEITIKNKIIPVIVDYTFFEWDLDVDKQYYDYLDAEFSKDLLNVLESHEPETFNYKTHTITIKEQGANIIII